MPSPRGGSAQLGDFDDGLEHAQAGQYVRFDSDDPTDVARWLLDGNDD
jgi:hypothetical protein